MGQSSLLEPNLDPALEAIKTAPTFTARDRTGRDGRNGHAFLDPSVRQLLPQGVLQVIADIAPAHGYAQGQGMYFS